jgi:O-antigen/teichoic acid export membrane protein
VTGVARVDVAGSSLVRHLREPMHRSAYALILGSAVTSGLGYLFWIVAARRFDAAVVGTATTMIASMGFLANFATLGLRSGLVRFLPTAGASATGLVRRSYLLCAGAAALAAAVFLAGQPLWAADLVLLRDSTTASVVFVGATACWVIMVLQEHVLTGLHRATWAPVASTAYSSLKILLLVLLVGASAWSIFAAYVLPAVVVLVIINVLVLRAVARSTASGPVRGAPPLTGLARFAAGDHTAAMLWLATTDLLPLLVLARAGAGASAYYYLAFTAAYTLFLVTSNVGSALVAEAARDTDRLYELAARAVRNGLLIVVPAVAVGVLAAPFVLHLLGRDYARAATDLLRLVLLSAIPQVIVGIGVSVCRVQRRIGRVIAIYATIAVLVFTGAELALRTVGLTGVGVAWLLTQTVVAIALLCTQLSFLWTGPASALVVRAGSAVRRAARRRARSHEAVRVIAPITGASEHTFLTSDNETLVVAAVVDGQDVVVKVARSPRSTANVRRHAEVLRELRATPGARAVHDLLPVVLQVGERDGASYTMESRLPGRAVHHAAGGAPPPVAAEVARTVDSLHRGTAVRAGDERQLVARLVREPFQVLAELPGVDRAGLAHLEDVLSSVLRNVPATVSWTHGDCWLGNVLVDRAAGTARLTALIDWEDARRDGLPDIDLAHLWLTAQGGEIGGRLVAALGEAPASAFDRWLTEAKITRLNPHLAPEVVLVLAWLTHVHAGVRRCPPHGPSRMWRRRTLHNVLPRIGPLLERSLHRSDVQ